MSTDLKTVVTEEVSEQLAISDLLDDGSITDSLDGGDLGAAVGRRVGEQLGREVGAAIGRELHLTTAEGIEANNDLGEIRSELASGIRAGVSEAMTDASIVESATSITGDGEADIDDEAVAADEDESSSGDGKSAASEESADDEVAEETAAEAEETAVDEAPDGDEQRDDSDEDGAEPAEEQPSQYNGEISTAALAELRTETLADFLEVMSHEDLQSVAQDVGVDPELGREQLTDEIIDAVSTQEEQPA